MFLITLGALHIPFRHTHLYGTFWIIKSTLCRWYFKPIGFEIAGFFGSVTPSGSAESIDLTSYTKFIWLVSSGVHYYYNNKHLVFLGYRYRRVFSGYSQSTSTTVGFVVQPWHSFVVGYAYKF